MSEQAPWADAADQEVWVDVLDEMQRAKDLHGDMSIGADMMTDPLRLAILTEEVGEVARATVERCSWPFEESGDLRAELVQVAACAIAWVNQIDGAA